jgi:hypothetical protein
MQYVWEAIRLQSSVRSAMRGEVKTDINNPSQQIDTPIVCA